MPDLRNLAKAAVLPALALASLSLVGYRATNAADHLDSPQRTDPAVNPLPDKAADIADIYTFHDDTNFVVIMTFAGPQSTTLPATYDRDMLYTINISNAGERTDTEIPIEVRFGVDASNRVGVQFKNLPGGVSVEGPVESDLTSSNGIKVRAGLFDDPFFFDLQGFRESRAMGTLRFNNQRNFFAGQNITAVVIQIPLSLIQNGTHTIDVWGSSSRFLMGEL